MKKSKIAAVALASVFACGLAAGCDLVTTDPFKDYEQVIAEVDLSKSADFAEGGKYAAYKDAVGTAEIVKRDMVAMFVASGSTVMGQYGWTYKDTFNAIADSLINRQVYLQYAKVFFLSDKLSDDTPRFKDENDNPYTVEGYKAAVEAADADKDLAGLTYFLTPTEEAKALYDLRVSFNNTIDSLEETIIENRKTEEDEHDHDEDVRTTPTGINTSNEDYYDEAYRIYTGVETSVGSYERVDDSTATTRREAYASFLSNLRSSGLLLSGEDTSKTEELSYFKRELKNAYESAMIDKMNDAFEDIAAERLSDEYMQKSYDELLSRQNETYEDNDSGFESALDSLSDSSFLLAAPKANYGFVINILLPFNAAQTEKLNALSKDTEDTKGNKFVGRANILKTLTATDQRGTWFSGEEDYSFDGTGTEKLYTGTLSNSAERKYLFFEDSLQGEDSKYEPIEKYAGHYTYNGTVTPPAEGEGNGHYKTVPFKINIEQFLDEMEGYLTSEGLTVSTAPTVARGGENYYKKTSDKFYKDGENGKEVDYSAFVYYQNKVELKDVDANTLFKKDTDTYKAFSVINELSFAYNTDTAGLNKYLGYSVTPDKTSFVSEFEYAAQVACKAGAGTYIVVPSDYGWHIIYCTFSFPSTDPAFVWTAADKETEGTFSYNYFEAMKASVVSSDSSNRQTEIINSYADECSTLYERRFADLTGLDTNN